MSFAPTLPINYVNDNASSPLLGYIDSSSETKIANTIASSIIAKTKDVSLPWLICEVDGMATRSIVKVIDVIVAAKKAKNDPFPPPPPPLDTIYRCDSIVSVSSISKLDIYMNSDDETTTTPTTVGSSALTTQARDDCYRESVLLPPPLPTTTTTTTLPPPPPPPPPLIELLTLSPHTPCIATVISFLNDNDRRTVRVTTCYLRDAIDGYHRIVILDSTMLASKQSSQLTEAIGIMKWKTRLDRSNFEETVTAPQQSLEGRRCYMVTNVNEVMTDDDDDDDDAIVQCNDRRNILTEMDDLLPDIPTRIMTRVLDMNDKTTDVISTVRDSIPMFVTVVTNNTDKDGTRDNDDKYEESKLRPLCSPFRLSYEEENDDDDEEKGLVGKFNNVHDIITNTSFVKMSSDAEIQIPSSSNVIPNFMTMDSDSVSSADDPFTGIANVIAELDELSSNPQYSRCHRKRNDDDSALTLLKSNVITRNTIIEDDDTLSQTSDVVIFGQTTKAYTQFMYEIMDDVRAFIGGGDDTVRIDDTGPIKIGNKFYSKSEAMRHWRKAKKKLAYTELVNECNDEMDNLTIKEQQTAFFLVEKVGHTSSAETHHIENREIVSSDRKYTLKPIDELTESPNEIIAVSENVGVARSRRCVANEELCIDKKKRFIADTDNRSLPSAQDVLNDTIVMHKLKEQQQQLENELFHQYHHRLDRKTPPHKVLAFSSFITNGEDIDDAKCNKSSSRSCVCIGNEVVDDDKVSSTSESTISTIVRRKIVSIQNIRSWGGSQVTPVSSYTVTEVQQHVMKANAALKLA